VDRDAEGKEIRYPVILSAREKVISRTIGKFHDKADNVTSLINNTKYALRAANRQAADRPPVGIIILTPSGTPNYYLLSVRLILEAINSYGVQTKRVRIRSVADKRKNICL
jgi:uncharacterized ParB-like nuclease family protein